MLKCELHELFASLGSYYIFCTFITAVMSIGSVIEILKEARVSSHIIVIDIIMLNTIIISIIFT